MADILHTKMPSEFYWREIIDSKFTEVSSCGSNGKNIIGPGAEQETDD